VLRTADYHDAVLGALYQEFIRTRRDAGWLGTVKTGDEEM
jgi:hypothetical protein